MFRYYSITNNYEKLPSVLQHMCPRRVKNHDFIALRVFNNIHAASLPQNVYYRVIAVREGGHAPETRLASSDMPPHHPACMRARCDAPVALLPPSALVPPNPVAFDHGIYTFDFARTGFDQWTSPPGCIRSAHRNTLEQHPGQTHSKIPSV